MVLFESPRVNPLFHLMVIRFRVDLLAYHSKWVIVALLFVLHFSRKLQLQYYLQSLCPQ